MSTFEPIAIVGQAAVLPGALTPEALWETVVSGRAVTGPAPPGAWRISPSLALGPPGSHDRTHSDVTGAVSGFEEHFCPTGLLVPEDHFAGLDPLFRWVVHAAREALAQATGRGPIDPVEADPNSALILGNLCYPTAGMAAWVEAAWLDRSLPGRRAAALMDRPDPRDRFMSGLPAHTAAAALGLGGGSFSLDAACASSLYAIKLACDRLQDREADLVLAGAVNRADDLFLHIGFSALRALSRSGRSRPFHREADGLIPAEGAGFVALRRLSDATARGDRVLGVIRGIGLSNDGRAQGLLVPSSDGQLMALQAAYSSAGLSPSDVSYVECHATGTPVGDRTELATMARLWGRQPVALGSLKGNLGHLITASGVAGLLKVLGAIAHRTLPPSLGADDPVAPLGEGGPLQLVTTPTPWDPGKPRRAAVSAFGFGGNNAHLIVEEPGLRYDKVAYAVKGLDPVVIVGMGVIAGQATGAAAFSRAALGAPTGQDLRRASEVRLPVAGTRFPPNDLRASLPQQTMLLAAAGEALSGVRVEPSRAGVFAGMGTDVEVGRHGLRWRLRERARRWPQADEGWVDAAMDAASAPLEAAGVVGAMPNVVANRVSSQHDLRGMGFSVSAEEASGLVALRLAARALRSGELDVAVAGAVDLCCSPAHEEAAAALGLPGPPGDAAVVLVLKRASDARRDGERALARLDDDARGDAPALPIGFGHAHAASGLLQVAAVVASIDGGVLPGSGGPRPWLGGRSARVAVRGLGGVTAEVGLASAGPAQPTGDPRLIDRYGAADTVSLAARLRAGRPGGEGPARAATWGDARQREAGRAAALKAIQQDCMDNVGRFFHVNQIKLATADNLALVFTGAASPYAGMSSALLTAFPEVTARLGARFASLPTAARPDRFYPPPGARPPDGPDDPVTQMLASSFVAQAHAVFSLTVLGLRPAAALGYSLGESNMLHALGAWDELDGLCADLQQSPLFRTELAGDFAAVRRAWARTGRADLAAAPGPVWASHTARASREAVEAAVAALPATAPPVHLLLVNAPDEVVIGGHPDGCRALLDALGVASAPLPYALAVHCPEVREVGPMWRAFHRRTCRPVPGVRFYSGATATSYEADAERAADALLGHAVGTLDFARLVRRAWDDGLRVFVEHGPRSLCAGWIGRTLGDRPHLAVSLDAPGLTELAEAVGRLWACGVDIADLRCWDSISANSPEAAARETVLPAHPPDVVFPPLQAQREVMAPVPSSAPPATPRPDPAPRAPAAAPARPPPLPRQPEPPLPQRPAPTHPAPTSLVAGVHRDFLAAQAAAHTQFLALRAQMTAALLGAPRAATGAAPVAAPAATPPSPADIQSPWIYEKSLSMETGALPGPAFDRAALERLASGRISSVLGPLFARQDAFPRQVRMPEPPLLLADRVLGIDAEPGVLGPGTIWTETDVTWGSWYLHHGAMPSGLMIEAGQADLLLISWMGADFQNRGERVYRLLGCTLTWHGPPPRPGETLRYAISIDGFARNGDILLFFFRYDCTVNGELRLVVRSGQAGFFSDEELAKSEGVLWDPADEPTPGGPMAAPLRAPPTALDREALDRLAAGDLVGGLGQAWAVPHVRTPTVAPGRMLLLDRVTHVDPAGGPWGRGYLRAELDVRPDLWFFAGHFKDDPCMPGTLMFEACVQAMALYLMALGFSLERDGWRFEPVRDRAYPMRCRGQVSPGSKRVVTEVFVAELHDGDRPTLVADVLVTVDGLKAYHCARLGVELQPDWPLWDQGPLPGGRLPWKTEPSKSLFDEFALLSSATGRPSDAFGDAYRRFDGARRAPRLPGPPYHLAHRVLSVDTPQGSMATGCSVVMEADIAADAWHLEGGELPFCVLQEVALQPCGWLASWVGCALAADGDLFFRNLDGTGTALRPAVAGTLQTRVTLSGLAASAGMTLVQFEGTVSQDGAPVYRLETGFGFFSAAALASQAGLPVPEAHRALPQTNDAPSPTRIPAGPLRMIDEVVGWWPDEGRLTARFSVDICAWFFQAHFYQDPVQPGSLGLEALLQALREVAGRMFPQVPVTGWRPGSAPMTWRYRGQVRPHNREGTVEVVVTEASDDRLVADGWLSVDGVRIYAASGLSISRRAEPGDWIG